MLQITERLAIPDHELVMEFVRSGGPGGQNVNKLSTAVRLRYNLAHSTALPPAVRARLATLAGRRLGRDGILTIVAQRFRTQEQNRQDALDRLAELVRAALVVPRARRATRPTRASRKRRLENKRRHGAVKTGRRAPGAEE